VDCKPLCAIATGVSALYTHDFADREATLSYDAGSGVQPLATACSYKSFGPLTTLTLANGLTESHLFDNRYFADRIQVGSLLDWDYTEDAVGNPTQISGTILNQTYTASFAYQDNLYFLTQGNGAWGSRTWTYDRIGNRLISQESGNAPQPYTYAGTGHNPKLTQITPAPGFGTGSLQFTYDAAGNPTAMRTTFTFRILPFILVVFLLYGSGRETCLVPTDATVNDQWSRILALALDHSDKARLCIENVAARSSEEPLRRLALQLIEEWHYPLNNTRLKKPVLMWRPQAPP
jgi:hypothetical protein